MSKLNTTEMSRSQKQRRNVLKAIPAIASVLVLPQVKADTDTLRISRVLMGTQTDLSLHGAPQRDLQQAAELALQEMNRLEQMMSRYRSTSVVSALNLMAGIRPVEVPEEMMQVLEAAQRVSAMSQGAFDVTVGAYKDWDFDPAHPFLPSPEVLEQQARWVAYRDLQLDVRNRRAFLTRRGMRIDLGGIAKLPVLQAGMAALRKAGVENAMINGGGDVIAQGALRGQAWRIGLRDPRSPERLLGSVSLSQGVVAASGDYERCFRQNGRLYHHILNPKDGYPAHGPHGLALVSSHPETVNGLGAAIMVAGLKKGQQWLDGMNGVDAMVVDADQHIWLSEGMRQRLG